MGKIYIDVVSMSDYWSITKICIENDNRVHIHTNQLYFILDKKDAKALADRIFKVLGK